MSNWYNLFSVEPRQYYIVLNFKKLFFNNQIKDVKNINAYLFDGPNIIVEKKNYSISNLPKMSFGNMPLDNGNLILSNNERGWI